MKKVLLASTALLMSAGVAAAEVSVGGDGRMGVRQYVNGNVGFTSRIRISFSASGETDAGLSFGGSIRADNAGGFNLADENGNVVGDDDFSATDPSQLQLVAGGGVNGQEGNVFIEGAFGKLSMGSVDSAAKAAVGHVSGVGLTGLSDWNEMTYIGEGNKARALYEYAAGDFAVYISASNPLDQQTRDSDAIPYAVGGSYSFGNFTVALGYEDNDAGTDHVIGGVTASFGDFTGKVTYGKASGNVDGDQYAVSGDYTFGAATVTAFYADSSEVLGQEAYGLGASYDLGGGASLKAGYAKNDTSGDDQFDFGVSFSF